MPQFTLESVLGRPSYSNLKNSSIRVLNLENSKQQNIFDFNFNNWSSLKGSSVSGYCSDETDLDEQLSDNTVHPDEVNFTHFICLPIKDDAFLANYKSFKHILYGNSFDQASLTKDNLKNGFQKSYRLHVTLMVLSLPQPEDVEKAVQILKNVEPKIMDIISNKPLSLQFIGIDVMGDKKKSKLLVTKPSPGDTNTINKIKLIAKTLSEAFEAKNTTDYSISTKKYDDLNLHVTLYRYPQNKNGKKYFDATDTIEKFKCFDFGRIEFTNVFLAPLRVPNKPLNNIAVSIHKLQC